MILKVDNLSVEFPGGLRAVDGVSLDVAEGETLGLVGESGCGKSTLAKAILQLLRPTSGRVFFQGRELTGLWRKSWAFRSWVWSEELRLLRKKMQMIFQDPYGSLNPRMTAGDIVGEPLSTFGAAFGVTLRKQIQELLARVNLDPDHMRRYPHEFSGGQRQRIGIARALALKPELIVADEPVSALDVSVRGQILNLLRELQKDLGFTMVFISHDPAVVSQMADRIFLMHRGSGSIV